MSTHEESMVIDARGAVQALFSLDCKYCEQGFDGGEHTPCLSTCGHLYCDECIQDNAEHDESIKCVCGGKIDAGDATECFGLKTLFAHLSSCPALRCANCERLHPFDNCVRLRFDHDLERIFCVWCAAMKLNEDSDVIAIHLDDEISEDHLEFSIRSPQDEMMVSLGKEGMELMRTIVCCCLCEKRIKVKKTEQRRGAFRQRYNLRQEMRDAVVPAVSLPFTILPNSPTGPRVLSNRICPAQALNCGHFVCSQRCLSEKIDGSDISCGFCGTEIEEDGIKAEFLDEVLETASEGEKCATCLNYRTRKDFCRVDQESRCVWCVVESKTVDANECATGILIEID